MYCVLYKIMYVQEVVQVECLLWAPTVGDFCPSFLMSWEDSFFIFGLQDQSNVYTTKTELSFQ